MKRHIALLVAVFLIFGCSDDNTTNSLASFSPEIVNDPDAFQFQVTDAENVTTTVTYTWQNSGSRATVDHSSAISSGTGVLTLLDADEVQVYSSELRASGNEPSAEGTPGTWTIRLSLDSASGTMNFRAEKL